MLDLQPWSPSSSRQQSCLFPPAHNDSFVALVLKIIQFCELTAFRSARCLAFFTLEIRLPFLVSGNYVEGKSAGVRSTIEGKRRHLEGDSLGSSRTCKSAGLRYLARSSLGNSPSIASSPLNSARCSSTYTISQKLKIPQSKMEGIARSYLLAWPVWV